MKILDVLVNVAGELQEFLHCVGRLLIRCLKGRVNMEFSFFKLQTHLVASGLAAALNPQKLIDCVGLDRVLSGTGFCLERRFLNFSIIDDAIFNTLSSYMQFKN